MSSSAVLLLTALVGFAFCLWAFSALTEMVATLDLTLQESVSLAGKLTYSLQAAVDVAVRDSRSITFRAGLLMQGQIAIALSVFLWRLSGTEVKSTDQWVLQRCKTSLHTDCRRLRLLKRLIMVSFETGAITTAVALACLITFLMTPNSWVAFPFVSVIIRWILMLQLTHVLHQSAATGYFQALCMLYNLW